MKPFTKDLSIGSFGVEVYNLQQYLVDHEYASFIPTGFFGNKTHNALAWFQLKNNIGSASGSFGILTRTFINNSLKPIVEPVTPPVIIDNSKKLYDMAISCLGVDVTPLDEVPDEVACAVSVNAVFKKTFGTEIGGGASTALMRQVLISDKRFQKLTSPIAGCILISATGLGHNPQMPNGHVGIYLNDLGVASNNSSNGIFDIHYTLQTWKDRYQTLGGYPVEYFKVV